MPKIAARDGKEYIQWKQSDNKFRGEVGRYLAETGMIVEELGIKAQITKSTMYKRIKNPETMTIAEFRRLNKLLKIENWL